MRADGAGPPGDLVIVVLSAVDPVAQPLSERWGDPPATGEHVDGVPIRALDPALWILRRPGRHIHDERLDDRFPARVRARTPTIVFPSIHRSEQQVESLTVHPLGNPGATAEVGGRPRTLVRTDPRRMTATLRRLAEEAPAAGASATFEATHHGPELSLPAYFVEVGFGTRTGPTAAEVRAIERAIRSAIPDPTDRIALAAGGGHYAPHFTDLALRRRWAFGHILSRHALGELDRPTAQAAWEATPGAEGIVFARAADAELPALQGLAARLRDPEAGARPAARGAGDGPP